jgi:hypothetical protein
MDGHHLLDDVLAGLETSLSRADHDSARRTLGFFHTHLDRYIRQEERDVFPRYERAAGSGAATARMRQEHGALRRLLRLLTARVATRDIRGGLDTVASLRSVLLLHIAKEEWIQQRAAG